jgi:hypothetical protein
MTAARKHAGLNGTMFVSIDAASYHADPCLEPSLSSSIAWTLVNETPLRAWSKHPRLGGSPSKATKATDRGELIHALMLKAGNSLAVIKADNYATKAAREARDEARAAGKIPVLEDAYADAQSAVRVIAGRLKELGIKLNPKTSELGMLWVDHTSSGEPVQCRALLDNWAKPTEYDIKTVEHLTRDAINASIAEHGAHLQRAAYRRGLEANHPELVGRIEQRLLFVEACSPFDAAPVELDGIFAELGERLWQRALDTWHECLTEDYWPGVLGDERLLIATAPAWYVKRFED